MPPVEANDCALLSLATSDIACERQDPPPPDAPPGDPLEPELEPRPLPTLPKLPPLVPWLLVPREEAGEWD